MEKRETLLPRIRRIGLCAAAALGVSTGAFAATLEDVGNSFYPYRKGVPAVPGIRPGITITKDNVREVKGGLDPELRKFIESGWLEIAVGSTTAFTLHKNYIELTRKNLNKAKLGEKRGEIIGFEGGRAFPEEPDPKDPRAGEKLAWNYKYGINWGDGVEINPFYWKFRDLNTGKLERTLKLSFNFLNYKYRFNWEPLPEVTPNPSQLFRGIYVKAHEPLDIKDTQLLIQRYANDLKRDDAYLYLGFQRRARRLASGQITDSFLGTDLMIEDFEGYNGRVSDMHWTYRGTTNILMPFYNHNELKLAEEPREKDGYRFVDFGGKGGCFPDITWQLRKVYMLEIKPVDPDHPIGRRLMYADAETFGFSLSMIYDRKGELWKSFVIGKAHPDHHLPINKGTGVAIDDSFSVVDVQAKHCTTGQFKGIVDPSRSPPRVFTVQYMRGGD